MLTELLKWLGLMLAHCKLQIKFLVKNFLLNRGTVTCMPSTAVTGALMCGAWQAPKTNAEVE